MTLANFVQELRDFAGHSPDDAHLGRRDSYFEQRLCNSGLILMCKLISRFGKIFKRPCSLQSAVHVFLVRLELFVPVKENLHYY